MKYAQGIPCPDPNLAAGLRQCDIDAAYFGQDADDDRYERELDRADRMRDEEIDRALEQTNNLMRVTDAK